MTAKPTRVVAIIQARMGSSRLAGKVLLDIAKKPVLWHVINRVSQARTLDGVVVATTLDKEDDTIKDYCKKSGIPVFRGSTNDVLDRFYKCAKQHELTDIVRITADCPMHDPDVIDFAVGEYLKGGYDYLSLPIGTELPEGLDVEVFSFSALETAWRDAKLPSEREHVTPYIIKSGRFKTKLLHPKKKYLPYRLTLDNPEDYDFMKKFYDGIGKGMFHLDEIMQYLEKHQELLKINQHIPMNEGYKKSLGDDRRYLAKQALVEHKTKITGERICLRELTEKDATMKYCSWLNDPETNKFLETKNATIESLRKYIQERRVDDNCLFLGIFSKETKSHIGNIKLEPIDFESEKATLGVLIGDKGYWGKGIGTEAVQLLVVYAFEDLGLKRIELGVISGNKVAISCYQKAGFKIDRVEKRAKKVDDVWYDSLFMSVEKT